MRERLVHLVITQLAEHIGLSPPHLTLTEFTDGLPLLRVVDARVPVVGESVSVVLVPNAEGGRAAWFRSSAGVLLGPCADPVRAAEGVRVLLGPWVGRALADAGRRAAGGAQ